jgi:hypothetical protein
MRGVLSTLVVLLYTNVNFVEVLKEPFRKKQKLNLAARVVVGYLQYSAQFTIVKYLSLIYVGLT